MLTRGRKARVAVRPEAAHSALPPLHLPCVLDILSRLAPGERLLASAVSRAWRAAVAQPSLWTSVDFTQEAIRSPDALLTAVVSKAAGRIKDLRVWFCKGATSVPALAAAVEANANSLRSLNMLSTPFHAVRAEENGLCLMKDDVDGWLLAAPNLTSFEADVLYRRSDLIKDAHALLTGQGPYSVVRLGRLLLDGFSADEVLLLAREIRLHPSLEELVIWNTPLNTPAVLGAIADATIACDWSSSLSFSVCNLGPQSATYFARMLPHLSMLLIENDENDEPLFDAASRDVWAAALRLSSLTALRLDDVGLWGGEGVGNVLVDALVGHPTLEEISLLKNRIRFDDSQNTVGACWARLLAANSPSLRTLLWRSVKLATMLCVPFLKRWQATQRCARCI